MPWTEKDYPNSWKNFDETTRRKAIDIANAMLADGYKDADAIPIATAQDQNVVREFYQKVEQIYQLAETTGYAVNAAQHVWGYFKKHATEKEARTFALRLEKYQQGTLSLQALKRYLWKLTEKYQVEYLLQSLYFAF